MAKNTDSKQKKACVRLLEPLATNEWFTESSLKDVGFIPFEQMQSKVPPHMNQVS